ncbi:MAG: phosphatase [Paludibacteraceae bacterium]|nr:phosphatase [Paludibacteraceae bacterium]
MNTLLDLHTHTIVSGHAYSTMQEMVKAASEKGLKMFGITEHGPAMPGSCSHMYFHNLAVIPRWMYGVELFVGAEINIMDTSGNLDLEQKDIDKLDIRLAGIHCRCFKKGTIEENTTGVMNVIKNKDIDIISHPADGTVDLLFEPIVLASKEYGTLLELNNSSLRPIRKKEKAHDNNVEMLRLCQKYEVPVIIGSDAHISFDVGCHDMALKLVSEIGFPEKLILNDKVDRVRDFINRRKNA